MKRSWILMVVGLALALPAAVASCASGGDGEAGSEPRSVTQLPLPENAISDELMLALRQAKNFHHIADVYLQNANLAKATDAVRNVLSIEFPANAPEAEDVKLDARARLAKLLVTEGKLTDAMKLVDDGIAGATRESFFLSNVYMVKAEIEEAIAVTLDDTDKAAADERRENAIRARLESIDIDKKLQDQLLRGVRK